MAALINEGDGERPALSFRDFGFTYPKAERSVLHGVDWELQAGAFALLTGATGSGKSTLLRSVKPELAPVGKRVGSITAQGSVGYVAQSPDNQIVCDTVWHELAFGLENEGVAPAAMRRRVAEIAHFFGIEAWFGQETARLSGGQKQLLNLASVLVLQPRILLLDEPTGQLDPVAAKNFLHALFRVNRECGITVVVATHAPESLAAYATELVRLEQGAVVRDERALSSHGFGMPQVGARANAAKARAAEPGLPDKPHAVRRSGVVQAASEKPAIELRDVFFRFERDLPWVLAGASLAVAPGSVHAIVGGNGSGKSTLLRLVAGTLKPERGRVDNGLRNAQALVPQDPRLLFACDTVHDELMEWSAPAGYGEAEAQEMALRFGLERLNGRHPSDLSGGQQQLLAEAKALLARPRLLLLDEPTKGLDAATKLTVARTLAAERARGTTVLMVSHDLSFVSCVADKVTMLFDGEDACTEPAEEFFENNLFFRPEPDQFTRLWCEEISR